MRHGRIIFILALALTLGACEHLGKFRDALNPAGESVFTGGTSITATVAQPFREEFAVVLNSYGVAVSAALAYKRLPFCRTGQTGLALVTCKRRSVVLQIQAGDRKVFAAVDVAHKQIRDNPTISPRSAIAAVRAAVADYNAILISNGVR